MGIIYKKRAKAFSIKMLVVSLMFLLFAMLFFMLGRYPFFKSLDSEVSISNKTVTVVLDPGHGGVDGGAEVKGIFEKDINLKLAKIIRDFLALYKVNCVMTRSEDVLLCDEGDTSKKKADLLNRVKITNTYESPIFVSVHMNKFPISKYSGLQVFYSTNNDSSLKLAEIIQEYTVTNLQPENKRQVKPSTSSIYVLDRLESPAVLVECGFMSNDEELEKLTDDVYQKELAFIICESILNFINQSNQRMTNG